jgi:hypothetical protein
MRTKLQYVATKEKRFDYEKGKEKEVVIGKSYIFTSKSESVTEDFGNYLAENGVRHDYFKDGEEPTHIEIYIKDMEAKEYIKELYDEWKLKNK